MRRVATTLLLPIALTLVGLSPGVSSAVNTHFIFLGRLDAYADYNDVWGYTDPNTGDEYALLGTGTGTSIVNISDPFNPRETGFIPGPQSIWRDVHTYQGRAYIVTEGVGSGLQIVSLADPEAPSLTFTKDAFTAHTLWIDEGTGVIYCNGSSGGASGFRAYDLGANLDNPPLVTIYGSPYIHDLWVGGGVAYTADIYGGGEMRILNVSALPSGTSITQTGIVHYPSGATHNCWPHQNGDYVLTTDERQGGTVRVFDVSVPSSPIQISSFPALTLTSVHNVYVKGDTAYCAWYAAGIRAFDISDPFNPVNVGRYDTSPQQGIFIGCWSVYPYLPSGAILCADMEEGLFLVAHVDSIGAVTGVVTRAENGAPIEGAIVSVPGFYNKTVATDSAGRYTAELPGGAQSVIVSFPGYLPDTASVAIADGDTTAHDVALASPLTAVEGPAPASAPPPAVALSAAHPNPTRAGATLDLALPRAAAVRASVFDASGRRVRSIASGTLPPGRHALAWDGADDAGRALPDGTYLYRIDADGQSRSSKITIVR